MWLQSLLTSLADGSDKLKMMLMLWSVSVLQHPMILDANSDPEKVHTLLTRLQGRMDALNERAATFKNYQKTFKVTSAVDVRTSILALDIRRSCKQQGNGALQTPPRARTRL